MDKTLVVIIGPTASGKTKLGIDIAIKMGGEIVSADSMQVYKLMDIGTAKPTEEERKKIPHHLIDVVYPHESFTAYDYQKMAVACIKEISDRGRVPLMVGGTGLYVKAVLEGYDFDSSQTDWDYRKRLERFAEEKGNKALHSLLHEIDPNSAKKIHPNDVRRIIRALEVYNQTGKPISDQKKKPSYLEKMGFGVSKIGLTLDREKLYRRIEQRVDEMISAGLIKEVENLLALGYSTDLFSMKGLGYKQIAAYLENKMSLEEAVEETKQETRRYAKRQYTWFRSDKAITWFDVTSYDSVEDLSRNVLSVIKDI